MGITTSKKELNKNIIGFGLSKIGTITIAKVYAYYSVFSKILDDQ